MMKRRRHRESTTSCDVHNRSHALFSPCARPAHRAATARLPLPAPWMHGHARPDSPYTCLFLCGSMGQKGVLVSVGAFSADEPAGCMPGRARGTWDSTSAPLYDGASTPLVSAGGSCCGFAFPGSCGPHACPVLTLIAAAVAVRRSRNACIDGRRCGWP